MADSTGKDPKAGESGSGVVKPPVLDLKARPSATAGAADSKSSTIPPSGTAAPPKPGVPPTGKADDKPAASASPAASSSAGKPAGAPPQPKGAGPGGLVGAAIVGGVLGLGGAYGLAVAGLWPAPPQTAPVADPQIAALSQAVPELETVTQTTQSELARASQRIAALESAAATPPAEGANAAPDVSGIEESIAALNTRIDELAAAPTGAGDSAALESLRVELAGLGNRLDEVAARVGSSEASLKTLEGTVSATSDALAQQPSDIGAVLQLPLILSGLETAFESGRPYETELAALRAGLPDAAVPTVIANAAATGLPRPDAIARRFADVIPAMLAGRPADPDAGWQAGALDWFAGVIALQPSGEIEGDSPDALLSRAKAAVDRRDFSAAKSLIESLPASMRTVAGDVPALVADQAAAQDFLSTLRSQALAGEVKP